MPESNCAQNAPDPFRKAEQHELQMQNKKYGQGGLRSLTQLKWNQFGSIEDVPQLMEYLDGRQYKHGHYFHYTCLGAINGILGTRTFWVSNVSKFNDRIDQKQLDTPQF